AVLKNLRAGIMPPEKKPRPAPDETRRLENWIKHEAFGIDPGEPDPGRDTIRDLMGFDFKADEEFPPDDTGYGFDNIGDVLSISPLLLEKYMQAAETIVAGAVPTVGKIVQEESIPGSGFHKIEGKGTAERLSFFEEANLAHTYQAENPG